MRQEEIAKKVQKLLNKYIPHPKIPLDHKDPFTLLVAVVLSAHCTDIRVNKVTPALFKLADTPKKMARLPKKTIEKLVHSCGLYQTKAKALSELSKILVKTYHGRVPKTLEELESLPGVGHKTASVVLVQAFSIPAFPVDTHIFRLARRWKLSSKNNVKNVEEDLKKLFPKKSWKKLHLQLIAFGKKYCPAKAHKKAACPICKELA
jgi:endonuclease-3